MSVTLIFLACLWLGFIQACFKDLQKCERKKVNRGLLANFYSLNVFVKLVHKITSEIGQLIFKRCISWMEP